MGLFNALVDVASAATKVALAPVALVADVAVKVTTGAIKSAGQDIEQAIDDIID